MPSRIERLRARLHEQGLAALLVTKREHIYYLAGFSGSFGALLVTGARQWLVSDSRYQLQAAEEAPDWQFIRCEGLLHETLRQLMREAGDSPIGIEADDMPVATYRLLCGEPADTPFTLTPTTGVIEALRLVKEPEEIARIRAAVRITDDALAHLVTLVKPGVTEHELALEAEWFMRRHGAEAMAFDVIIAAGAHSALPHAQPGARPLQAGDLVVVDMGARYAHYCADMTRTFAVTTATPIAREIYRVCTEAQLAGIAGIRAGMTGKEADRVVRSVIEDAGYGDNFGHGTGHGVGLEIHEAPRISRLAEEMLPAGTTVTIEPGIYLPEVGGVRMEDLTLLTTCGVEPLTAAPKPSELPIYG